MPGSLLDPASSEMHTEGYKEIQEERREGDGATKPYRTA